MSCHTGLGVTYRALTAGDRRYLAQIGRRGAKRNRQRLGRILGRWQLWEGRHRRFDLSTFGVGTAFTLNGFNQRYRHHDWF
jgi:hypothetical protein